MVEYLWKYSLLPRHTFIQIYKINRHQRLQSSSQRGSKMIICPFRPHPRNEILANADSHISLVIKLRNLISGMQIDLFPGIISAHTYLSHDLYQSNNRGSKRGFSYQNEYNVIYVNLCISCTYDVNNHSFFVIIVCIRIMQTKLSMKTSHACLRLSQKYQLLAC